MRDTYEYIIELNTWIEEQLRPGNIPIQIYQNILDRVGNTSFAPHFMVAGENQVRFVAHSVGLELGETPVIAHKFYAPVVVGVVLAVVLMYFITGCGGYV